jgi:hypothetical protein
VRVAGLLGEFTTAARRPGASRSRHRAGKRAGARVRPGSSGGALSPGSRGSPEHPGRFHLSDLPGGDLAQRGKVWRARAASGGVRRAFGPGVPASRAARARLRGAATSGAVRTAVGETEGCHRGSDIGTLSSQNARAPAAAGRSPFAAALRPYPVGDTVRLHDGPCASRPATNRTRWRPTTSSIRVRESSLGAVAVREMAVVWPTRRHRASPR